jgi:hypothetical protein
LAMRFVDVDERVEVLQIHLADCRTTSLRKPQSR